MRLAAPKSLHDAAVALGARQLFRSVAALLPPAREALGIKRSETTLRT